MNETEIFAEIILPIGFGGGLLTYSVPKGTDIGARVRVTVRHRELIGIVRSFCAQRPSYRVLPVLEVIDSKPLILPSQIDMMCFASQYYADSMADVMKSVFPSRIRAEDFNGVTVSAYKLVAGSLKDELDTREKHRGQYRALMAFAQSETDIMTMTQLKKFDVSSASLKKLCEENVLQKIQIQRDRYDKVEHTVKESPEWLCSGKPVLLSGGDWIAKVKQIAGTILIIMPQADDSVISEFYSDTAVRYFQSDTQASRTQTYLRILRSPESADIVLGGRAALFLPFVSLSAIVVLDEHEERWRGQRSPHFNGRDMAIWLAKKMNVPLIFVSQSPSLETMKNIREGNYIHVNEDTVYPVKVLEKGRDLLSSYARQRMSQVLSSGKKVLVFQNRRGYAGHVECTSCGHIPGCPRCSVLLSFHASERVLMCHYCGYKIPYDGHCPECHQEIATVQGYGTERLASTLSSLFPKYPVSVLDSDKKEKFNPEAMIIVGTSYLIRHDKQMENIGLILVANADNLLTNSDFRAEEKAFRMLMALRTTAQSFGAEFIVQTKDFRMPIFKSLETGDYTEFYNIQLSQRMELDFPPYSRLVRLEFRHMDRDRLYYCVGTLHRMLQASIAGCTISPVFEPDIDRIDMEYIVMIVIRIPRSLEGATSKRQLIQIVENSEGDLLKGIRTAIEVDPQ